MNKIGLMFFCKDGLYFLAIPFDQAKFFGMVHVTFSLPDVNCGNRMLTAFVRGPRSGNDILKSMNLLTGGGSALKNEHAIIWEGLIDWDFKPPEQKTVVVRETIPFNVRCDVQNVKPVV
jgi:hypothetical protein